MPKYQHKPQEVEALQYTGANSDQVIEFSHGEGYKVGGALFLESKNHHLYMPEFYWIVRDNLGKYMVLKDKDFNDTFDEMICEPTT